MVARAEAAAATQERMLASAWRQFSERPYEQVRLADIAADAGVTVQTLHARFGTKDELFVAAWIWAIGPEGARRDSAPVGDVRAAVRLIYDSYERRATRSSDCWPRRTGFPPFTRWPEAGRAWHRAWVERTFAPLLAGLKGAARERRLVCAGRGDRPAGLEIAASRNGARSRDGRADRDRDDHRNERGVLMARLLAYLSASSGNTFPAIDMLLELQRRGHEVHVRSRASDVDGYAALGLRAAAIDPSIEQVEFDDWRGRSQVDSFMRMVRAYRACAKLEIPDLRQAIAEVDPDALIVDINCFGAMFVAEASELPWAVYCPYPPPFRSDDVPPHGLGLRPARGPLGKARDRMVRKFGDRQLAPELAQFNDLRAGLGLPAVRKFDDQFLRSDLFIAFTAEPYEYHRSDWPAHVRLVGPGLWEPPADPPAWLEAETPPDRARDRFDRVSARREAHHHRARGTRRRGRGGRGDHCSPGPGPVPAYRPMRAWSSSCRTPRSWPARHASFHTAARGSPRKHSPPASPCASCRSPATSSTSPAASSMTDAGVRLHHKRLNPERLRVAVHTAITKRPGAERIAQAFAHAGGPSAAADGGRRTADRPRRQDRDRWAVGTGWVHHGAVTIAELWRRGQAGWPRRPSP